MATYGSASPYLQSPAPPNSASITYHCDSCKQTIPLHRPRLRCLSCVDYDSCSDCHVMQSFVGSHCLEHKSDVYVRGQKLYLREIVASEHGHVSAPRGVPVPAPPPAPSCPPIPTYTPGYPSTFPPPPGSVPSYNPSIPPQSQPASAPGYPPSFPPPPGSTPGYNPRVPSQTQPASVPGYPPSFPPPPGSVPGGYSSNIPPQSQPSPVPGYTASVPPQSQPRSAPSYSPGAAPQSQPSSAPGYNPGIPPQSQASYTPGYTSSAPPQSQPGSVPGYNTNIPPQSQPGSAPGYNPNTAPQGQTPHASSPEAYWGMLVTPSKTASPMFSRLIAGIFTRFAPPSADVLQPTELCALMAAAGHSSLDFPALEIPTTSPANLQNLDGFLANWYRSLGLDYRTATRTFAAQPLPAQPHTGRVGMFDKFMQAAMAQVAAAAAAASVPPPVTNGLPLLSRRGLEQYFVSQALYNPTDLSARLNNLLGTVGALIDGATGRPFAAASIPRSCFPPAADPDAVHQRRMAEQQFAASEKMRMAAEISRAEDMLAAAQIRAKMQADANRAIVGGWRTDEYGNRRYEEGII